MEIFISTPLTIPSIQIILLLVLSTGALLMGRLKLALLINYCFTLYWGYIANMDNFSTGDATTLTIFTFIYFGFGFLIVFLVMLGIILEQ
jgi:hypothetical protein